MSRLRARLLLCVSIPSSIASVNRLSSCVVRRLLLCVSMTVDPTSAFALACQPKYVSVENATQANAGVDAYATHQRERIKGATKAASPFMRSRYISSMQWHSFLAICGSFNAFTFILPCIMDV